jgi:hypothetical protein
MSIQELLEFRKELPFDHVDGLIALHNKIVADVRYELWNFREKGITKIPSSYAACNHIFDFKSLKPIQEG